MSIFGSGNDSKDDDYMECSCKGSGCSTCGNAGIVPKWLKDPDVTGEKTAKSWGWGGNK